MKYISLLILGSLFAATSCYADFQTVTIRQQSESSIGVPCVGNDSIIQLRNGKVGIRTSSGKRYSLNLDEQDEDLSAFVGSVTDSDVCVIALKYSENDVNESFSLFVFDEASGRFKPSSIKMVNNPEFLNDKIISEYMDGPKSRKDTACYSINAKDFFFCEQREQFSEKLERVEMCNEKSCAPPVLVRPGEAVPVKATVAIEKAHFYEKKTSESFDQKQSYLIKGDKVVLNDYHRGDEGLFYQVTFFGKKTVTAWLTASAILIDE